MKIEYKIYVVSDAHGNKEAIVVNEGCDTVQICSMKDSNYNKLYFESEAYGLSCWCDENDLTLKVIDMEYYV